MEQASENPDQVTEAANVVADELSASVFLYSGRIDRSGFGSLLAEMQPSDERSARPNTLMLLATVGGGADAAYRIARMMQMTSQTFVLCIPHICKSAGTLIALGANRLMMSAISEIGPLDVQLRQRDEIGEVRSGLVVRTALKGLAEETFNVFEHAMLAIKSRSYQTVTFEVSARIARDLAAQVMAPIYAQVDPHSLGNDLRDLNIATAYGERLSEFGGNVRDGTIQRLVEDYPSHDFIIDKAETEALFHHVDDITDSVNMLVRSLGLEVYSPQSPPTIKRLDRTTEGETHEANQETPRQPGLDVGRQEAGDGDQGGERKAGTPHAQEDQ